MVEKKRQSKLRIELTPEQREHMRRSTGNEAAAPELKVEELEARIAAAGAGGLGGEVCR